MIRTPLASLALAVLALVTTSCVSTPHADAPEQGRSPGIVVCATPHAAAVGSDVLERGGNAVDAAIATAFALAVTYPQAGNIGGGGFMVIRFPDGRATTLDFREVAPASAHAEMFLDENGRYDGRVHHWSHRAVGVPGTVAGLARAHDAWGTKPWRTLVEPAVTLAEGGFFVSPRLSRAIAGKRRVLARWTASADVFLEDGAALRPGRRWRQPDLARTLARIRDHGRDGFYGGETARLVVAEMRRCGGLITADDLAAYRAVERAPVRGRFLGHDVIAMGPPSSGGTTLIEMLNILEELGIERAAANSAESLHLIIEAMRCAYRDRARHLGDADFVDVPLEKLLDKSYAAELGRTISREAAGVSSTSDVEAPRPESPSTTHFSIVDGEGLAVSVTYTLEQSFGSGIVVPGAGFLLNNEMGDFNPAPGMTTESGRIGTAPNLAAPGKRMLSSMCPTILAKDGDLVAVLGSPGGRTIINTVLHLVLGLVVHGDDIATAVERPRMHHGWLPDRVAVERGVLSDDVRAALETMGHTFVGRNSIGRAHCIGPDRAGRLVGVADPRDEDGTAAATR